eukprot:8033712-Pyramimonas_sp.AAC.1
MEDIGDKQESQWSLTDQTSHRRFQEFVWPTLSSSSASSRAFACVCVRVRACVFVYVCDN